MNECNLSSICQNSFNSFVLFNDGGHDGDDGDSDDDDDDDEDNINRKAALETQFTSILLPHALLAQKRLHGSKNNSTQQRAREIFSRLTYTHKVFLD